MSKGNNLIVFSLDTDLTELIEKIKIITSSNLLLLSTHHLFELEKKEIKNSTHSTILFLNFSELLAEEDMVFCDEEADNIIIRKYGSRHGHLRDYFKYIKRIKNEIVSKRIINKFCISEGIILNNTLGIDKEAWLASGIKISYQPKKQKEEDKEEDKKKLLSYLSALKRRIRIPFIGSALSSDNPVSIIENTETKEKYLIMGSTERISQFFSRNTTIKSLSLYDKFLFNILLAIHARFYRTSYITKYPNRLFRIIIYLFLQRKYNEVDFISGIHGHRHLFYIASKIMGSDYYCIQDGYLPNNYTSCFYRYNTEVSGYLTWDNISGGTFALHNIPYKVSSIIEKKELKKIDRNTIDVKNILVLCSGAGDWTALKNRSDEDYMFEIFIDVAMQLPNVNVIYRPHPLWIYPEHQGVTSIKRLEEYTNKVKLRNLLMSQNVQKEGNEAFRKGNLSIKSISIKDEINRADIVFGDHSQTMVNAGSNGKMFASVNATRRRSFFDSINQFGFYCFKSSNEIVQFIKDIKVNSQIILSHNKAVEKYNNAT